MSLDDAHYEVLKTIFEHQNDIVCKNNKGAVSSFIDDQYQPELTYLIENDYIKDYSYKDDKTTFTLRAINDTDIRYYRFYTLTSKGEIVLENHINSIELYKRSVIASENSADSALRSAKAAEDSAKAAHKSNRISLASLIISAIAIICSIVIPVITSLF